MKNLQSHLKKIIIYCFAFFSSVVLIVLIFPLFMRLTSKTSAFITIFSLNFYDFILLNTTILIFLLLFHFTLQKLFTKIQFKYFYILVFPISFIISCGLFFDLEKFTAIASFCAFCISVINFCINHHKDDDNRTSKGENTNCK